MNLNITKNIMSSIRSLFVKAKPGQSEDEFLKFFREYQENYCKKDKRVMKQDYVRYCKFIHDYRKDTAPQRLDQETTEAFAEFLLSVSKGGGAASTFSRFKKAVRQAIRKGVIPTDPCIGIRCPSRSISLMKEILSEDEIRALMKNRPAKVSRSIQNAFLLSLYTGIRYCDIKTLTHDNIDYANRLLSFSQSKTKGHSAGNIVHIPLGDDILNLLPEKHGPSNEQSLIFDLPSHPTCMKALRIWMEEAGIKKHITWHCARHTFATTVLKNGADIRVVADLLGHSGLKYVEIYTRVIDRNKVKAIESLPTIQ